MKVPRQQRAENLALFYKLQESQTVASPQIPVVRQPEKSGCWERRSAVSQSNQLQDTETVASPHVHVVRQPEKSGSLDRTSSVSQSFTHLTIEREPVGTVQVNSDLNKLSAEAAAEHSNSFSENCEVSDKVCAHCLKKRKTDRITSLTGCKSFSYCNKVCQISDWSSHQQLCKSIQSLNPQN